MLAVAAHHDDVEFHMAGTLLRLKDAGAELNIFNIANGCCGSIREGPEAIARRRTEEARASAALAGATFHPPLVGDIEISHEPATLAGATAVVRAAKPDLILTMAPQDYMEDHQNAGRIAVTAAFCRGMPNYPVDPPTDAWDGDTVLYHAMPHGLRDMLRRRVWPGAYVDVAPVMARKREMLACHKSQKEWLDASQGYDSYLTAMEDATREVGRMSGRFEFAEGWRRHSHIGYSRAEIDPLSDLLGEACWIDPDYERWLERKNFGG